MYCVIRRCTKRAIRIHSDYYIFRERVDFFYNILFFPPEDVLLVHTPHVVHTILPRRIALLRK